jgi:hypothetical protein
MSAKRFTNSTQDILNLPQNIVNGQTWNEMPKTSDNKLLAVVLS